MITPHKGVPLDHLVINTKFQTDAAAALFSTLGFTLTPQGRHAMGSVNHLMVFDNDYLELIGLPTDGGTLRADVLNSQMGIDGLVFQAADAAAIHAALSAEGHALQPLHEFSRPLELEGETHHVAFRTVRFQAGEFDAGRVYFCEHVTPELIWRPQWRKHANTANGLSGLLIVSDEPEADARRYAAVADGGVSGPGSHGEFQVRGARYVLLITNHEDYARRYGDLACDGLGRRSFFGAVGLTVADPAPLAKVLGAPPPGIRHRGSEGRYSVHLDGFNCLLDFHHAGEPF